MFSKAAVCKITYIIDGQRKEWTIGCLADETEQQLKDHLYRWYPDATIIDYKIKEVSHCADPER